MKENIPLPALQSQRRVVRMLHREVAARQHVRGLAERLSEYSTRLIADVVTGKLDVRGATGKLLDGDPFEEDDVERAGG